MTDRAAVEAILKYIAEHVERESVFLSPRLAWNVEATSLLKYIGNMGVMPEAEAASFFDTERIRVERERANEVT